MFFTVRQEYDATAFADNGVLFSYGFKHHFVATKNQESELPRFGQPEFIGHPAPTHPDY
ncbi:MAG: hypothetical protein QGI88_03955 [SAR202 cluster bacterium]|nr:hypothetical protein [SAR202 cluster bacterium]